MTQYLGDYPDDHGNVDVYFQTFDSNDPSASVIVSAFVVGDVAVYKDGSVTQRSSTTGFTLLDTDGINFDGVTGIHGVSIDLSDNTDAGFFAAGSEYAVIIGPVTVDAATINFVAATFSIERAGGALAISKLIQAAVITNAAGVDVAADIIAMKAETALIVADTNELQTDDVPGLIAALDAVVDTVKAETVLILADTADIQPNYATEAKQDTIDTVVDAIKVTTDKFVFTTANQVDSNMLSISSDGPAADNLELMYDGTGYTDETGPASRLQVSNIGAVAGSSLSYEASADNTAGAIIDAVTIIGSITANLYTDTDVENGTRHQLTHATNAFDFIYRLSIGGGRTAADVEWKGYLTSSNDACSMQAYDFGGDAWDTVATISGTNGTTNGTVIAALLSKHTGTGSELGNVYIRFVCTGQTSPVLNTDLLLVQAVNIGQSVGYANGAIWLDTVNGVAGTEVFVNGVADNPVDLIASAKTLSTSVGVSDFHVINGSSITLAESTVNESYFGDNWTLALGGQTVTGAHFEGAIVSGVAVGAAEYLRCRIGTHTTIAASIYTDCGIEGTITLPVGTVYFENCRETGTTILDYGVAVASTTCHLHKHSGSVQINNFGDSGTDVLELDGNGKLTIDSTSTGSGTINIHGNWELIDNSTAGDIAITYNDRPSTYEGGQVWFDSNGSLTGQNLHIDGTIDRPSSAWADAQAIATASGLVDFHILNGAAVTLSATSVTNHSFFGDHWTLALASRDLSGVHVKGATVSGVGTATTEYEFEDCDIGAVTLDNDGLFERCDLSGTFTIGQAGTFTFHNCFTLAASVQTIDFGALGATTVHLFGFDGEVNFTNMAAGDIVHITGAGQITTTTCTGGTIDHDGFFQYTDAGGNITELQSDIKVAVDAVLVDTGTTIPAVLGTAADTDLATDLVNIQAGVPSAAQLAYIVENAATGLPVTFTTSGGSTTAAVLNQVDGASGSATDDQYNGRLLVFTNGTLKGVVTDITDYTGSSTTATITAIPTAPTASHTARLI